MTWWISRYIGLLQMHAICEVVTSFSFLTQTETDIIEPYTWPMVLNIMETLEDWGDGTVLMNIIDHQSTELTTKTGAPRNKIPTIAHPKSEWTSHAEKMRSRT